MADTTGKRCSRCGAQNDATSRFCSTCGQSLVEDVTTRSESASADELPEVAGHGPDPTAGAYQPPTYATESLGGQEIASAWLRLTAWLVDGAIGGVIGVLGLVVFGIGGVATGIGAFSPVFLVMILAYPVLVTIMVANRGQSPGKIVVGIKIVRRDGKNLGFGLAILREWIGKFVSSLILYLGFIWILFDAKRQGWHDKLADTVVVKVR